MSKEHFEAIHKTGLTTPEFGPNVFIFDPSMPAAALQEKCDAIFKEQEKSHFGDARYAVLFKPGNYDINVKVGFFTEVYGLGKSPDEVIIKGSVDCDAEWLKGNALVNFWRSVGNMTVLPTTGTSKWAVSQAAPFRRMHIKGSLVLFDGGWSSGGFISDSLIEGEIISGTQQQWYTRNSRIGSWKGHNWNMVFQGVDNAPDGDKWPNPPYTVIESTPAVREKPFLYADSDGSYKVFVPAMSHNSKGTTWDKGDIQGEAINIEEFYIAKPEIATAESINSALDEGKNILFTPGIYHLEDTIRVARENTVLLGLGLATLIPDNGVTAMTVADVDGVKLAGILFDAGSVESPILLQVGPKGSNKCHAGYPVSLHDVFFRVGGAGAGKASVSAEINSNNVIGDHFWFWRADHGDGVDWDINTTANGLIVNGDDVTIYGLFVEHYHQYQTLWNGDGGRTYFYQCEIPYDVPDQESWMSGEANGYAAYKVSDAVNSHEAWGLGIYCFFRTNPTVKLGSAIQAPERPEVKFHHMITVALGGGTFGEITHIVNNAGDSANSACIQQRLKEF